MTVVIGCITSEDKIVVISDSAIGCEDGYRRIMADGKWWDMGCLLIGESGEDFALSRLRQKTRKKKSWVALRDPYIFSEMVVEVQTEVKGDEGPEPLEAELLHISGDKDKKPIIHVIGGDGGITGPFPYTAVGHGSTIALPLLDALLDPRRMKTRTTIKVTNVLMEIMKLTERYADSVCGPFHHKVFDPAAEFKEL